LIALKLNYYIKVKSADLKVKNGYIHTIDHPLFPAPSILDIAFMFSDEFSTLTSAVQKVGGQKYLEWEYDEKNSKHGKREWRDSCGFILTPQPTSPVPVP
jgi:hypothetical protein